MPGQPEGGERAGLGHAPPLNDGGAEAVLEGLNEGLWNGGAAGRDAAHGREVDGRVERQQAVPDGRHTAGERRVVLIDNGGEALSHEVHLRHDHVGPGQPGAVGRAPGHGVEHGHDDEDAVRLGHADRGGRLLGHGVQPDGTVRVDDTLGVAGRPARVTHGCGGPLVELGPVEARLLGGEQPLVGKSLAEGRGIPLPHHDDGLDGLQVVLDGGQQRDERGVDDDATVLGVVDDVGQLVGREANVERVQHRAHGGDGEIGLEVALVVPAERADAVALLDAEAGQGSCELLGPDRHFGEGGPAAPPFFDGDDGAVPVDPLAMTQDVSDEEGASCMVLCIPQVWRARLSRAQGGRPTPLRGLHALRSSMPSRAPWRGGHPPTGGCGGEGL